MMKKLILAVCTLALVSCDGELDAVVEVEPSVAPSIVRVAPSMDDADEVMVTGVRKSAGNDGVNADEPTAQYLAYTYNAELQLPASKVSAVLRHHEEMCFQAGPQVCRVLRSSVREHSADRVTGQLEFAATRDFMKPFREGLASEAEAAEGRLVSMSAEVEDLSRQIVDTSARLQAQMTLRDRLIALLEKDTDDIGDLLEVEEQLANVQSEIEGIQSYLRILEGRVKMDRISLSYQSIRKPVSPSTGRPLQQAFSDFLYETSHSLANVVLFVAAALPWLIVLIPGAFVLRRFVRSFRKSR